MKSFHFPALAAGPGNLVSAGQFAAFGTGRRLFFFLFSVFCLHRPPPAAAQQLVRDQSIRYQQERMVFKQWDQNKFTPGRGFLSLNPYYWLVWGLFYPNYHKTDLRPLGPAGAQTQRLELVGAMSAADDDYKLHSDTIQRTAISQLAEQSGVFSDADPLWTLYYNEQFAPLLNHTPQAILAGLPAAVSARLLSEGTYGWYTSELDMLKERIEAAHSADMDRGSRILAYLRLLKEYRRLAAVWAIRSAAAAKDMQLSVRQRQLAAGQVPMGRWTPRTDLAIAERILLTRKF